MANRIGILSALVTIALGLASCSMAQTPEQCVTRFAEQFPNERLFDKGLWQSTLTYRLPDDFEIPELQPGAISNGAEEGPTFTLAWGPEQAAFDNFSRQEIPAKGAYLALNDVTYFRTRGPLGSPKEAASVGCTEGSKGWRLIRIDWTPAPRKTTA
jgi:hypothetical protein